MLTKDDLNQIRGIVTEVVTVELSPVKKDIKILKKNDVLIRKDINMVIGFFDRDYADLRKRLERIEKHLGLSNN